MLAFCWLQPHLYCVEANLIPCPFKQKIGAKRGHWISPEIQFSSRSWVIKVSTGGFRQSILEQVKHVANVWPNLPTALSERQEHAGVNGSRLSGQLCTALTCGEPGKMIRPTTLREHSYHLKGFPPCTQDPQRYWLEVLKDFAPDTAEPL